MSREQRSRITALAEQTGPGEKPTDDGYHLHQAKQMLALGGVWGSIVVGDASDDASVYYVPEPHTDSVLSIVGERFGLWGVGFVLLLFVLLVWRALSVADGTREPFGRLVAIGIAALLAVQVLVNAGMIVGLLPITGLALPLVSYGGSSLLANALALGLLLNIGLRPGYEVAREPFLYRG
jgi:cell division protein FtsW (lipid II flippase)